MRKNSKSFRGWNRANVQLETLERRQLLSSAVLATGSFTVAPRPTGSTSSDAVPTYVRVTTGTGPDFGTADVEGYTPAQIRAAYGLNQVTFDGVTGDGTGQTIAIIDAFDDPNIQQDLRGFDAAFNLPTASLTVVNQTGGTTLPGLDPAGAGNENFEGEEALDVEWAHALAPGAKLILVEATDSSPTNLLAGVTWARAQPGVSVVSMSFGGQEESSQRQFDADFTTPAAHEGVTFLASTGDAGEPGGYPAYSPNVVAVGGTTASIDTLGNYDTETGWSGSGGGISQFETQPAYQNGVVTQSLTQRTIPDVAFDADPLTGVPVFDTFNNPSNTPWTEVGGTSFATPAWAAIVAVTDQGRVIAGKGTLDGATQTLPMLYSAPSSDFHDITSGSNGPGQTAGAGYELVTGRGSPEANLLIPFLVTGSTAPPDSSGPTISAIVASSTTITVGSPLTLTAEGVGDPGATGVAVTFYEESNGVPGLQTGANGDLSFTPQTVTSLMSDPPSVTIDTTGLVPGVVTFYAQVTDASGAATATLGAPSVDVNVVAVGGTGPTVGAITARAPDGEANVVVNGQTLTLQASFNPADPSMRRVTFYQDTNNVPGLQTGPGGDRALSQVSASSNYTLRVDTTNLVDPIPGSPLQFYAVAFDSNGSSSAIGLEAPSVDVDLAPAGKPDAPVNLTATPISTTSIALTFGEVNSNQIGFEIDRATEPSFTVFTKLFTIDRPFITTFTDTGLSPGTRYFYRVKAFNHSGNSDPSLTADATTLFTPSKLGFAQQPLNQDAGVIARNIVVNVETPSGGVSTIDNSNVTLTIASGPTGDARRDDDGAGGRRRGDVQRADSHQSGHLHAAGDGYRSGHGQERAEFTVSPQTASAHLVLVQQPATPPLVGVKGVPAYVVDLDDQFGNLVTNAKSKVSVSVSSGPSFNPTGTTTVALKKGVGTFSNLILLATGNYVLHLTDSTFGTTAVVNEAVAIATTTIATPKNTTTTAGKNVTLTAHLTSNAPKDVPFSGFVSIGIEGASAFTVLAVGTLAANGTIKFRLADIPAGTYANVRVAYSGDVSHTAAMSGPFTLVVNPGVNAV